MRSPTLGELGAWTRVFPAWRERGIFSVVKFF